MCQRAKLIACMLCVFCVAFWAGTLQADIFWNVGTGDWSNGAIWHLGYPPANDLTSDTAYIQNGNVVTVSSSTMVAQLMVATGQVVFNADFLTGTPQEAPITMIGAAGANDGTAVQGNNATVTFDKGAWVGLDKGSTGTYTLDSGLLHIGNSFGYNYGLVLGLNSGSTGTFNQNGGSILVDHMFGAAGIREGDGTAAFNFNGGDISLPGDRIGFADDWDWFTPTAPSGYVYTETYDSVEDRTLLHFTVIPEPSTLALLGAGLVGLLCYSWRKRK